MQLLKLRFFFLCIFQAGAFTLISPLKLSYHLLVENKYVNIQGTPETEGTNVCLHARAMGIGTLYLLIQTICLARSVLSRLQQNSASNNVFERLSERTQFI